MALETVVLKLDETWRPISAAGAGRFKASVLGDGGALTFIGAQAPAADYAFGQPDRALDYAALDAKVWARAMTGQAIVCVTRTADAANMAETMLPKAVLSAASFAASLADGASIATITAGLPGARVEGLRPNDGRLRLSADRTELLRGPAPITNADPISLELTVSHPGAPNSPRLTTIEITPTLPAGGAVAALLSLARMADGSVGQAYTAAVAPLGVPVQWTRTTVGANPVTTDIAGAVSTSYVAQPADAGYVLGVRGPGGGASAKAAGRVLPAPILLDACDDLAGWSNAGISRTVEGGADVMQGAGGLRIAQTDAGTSAVISSKTIADVVAPADLGVLVFGLKHGFHSNNSAEVSLRRSGTVVAGVSLVQAIAPGRRIYSGRPYDFATGTVNGGGFQRGNSGVAEPAQPSDISTSSLYLRLNTVAPGKGEMRCDFVLAQAGGVSKFALTFDDGFASAFEYYINVLQPAGIPATFYPPAAQLNAWNASGGNGKAKTTLVIQAMRLGALIGTNTRNDNPFTSYADPAAAVAEFLAARQGLIDILRTDPIWNEVSDLPLLLRGLDFICLSNGLYQTAYRSSAVTATVSAGAPTVMTWAAAPATPPKIGAVLQGWWPEAGAAKVQSVAVDGLSVTMDRPITPQTKSAIFLFEDDPFFHQKLMNAFRAAGTKLVRSTPNFSYPSAVSDNPRMSTRFGLADYDMAMPAQAAPATTTAAQADFLGRWYDEGKHYQCTSVLYVHGVIDEATIIGVNTRSAALDSLVAKSAPDRASGAVEFVNLLQLYESDGKSSVPFR